MTEASDEIRAFFDKLSDYTKTLVQEGGEFETLGIKIERDFRGFRADVFSVRVLSGEGRGVMKEAFFKF